MILKRLIVVTFCLQQFVQAQTENSLFYSFSLRS